MWFRCDQLMIKILFREVRKNLEIRVRKETKGRTGANLQRREREARKLRNQLHQKPGQSFEGGVKRTQRENILVNFYIHVNNCNNLMHATSEFTRIS